MPPLGTPLSPAATMLAPLRPQQPSRVVTVVAPVDSTPPVTVFVSDTVQKVSLVTGWESTTVTWSADEDCQAWQVREVVSLADSVTAGLLLVAGGAITANQQQQTVVPASALSSGDGSKLVKIFARDLAGNWSL